MLTIHLLTRNHEHVVEKALQSVLPLDGKIVVGDLGSKDRTVEICRKYSAEVHNIEFEDDYSAARNALPLSEINLYIQPWEVLVSGHEAIRTCKAASAALQVFQDDNITKEIRLWTEGKFINPIFETLDVQSQLNIEGIIYCRENEQNYEETFRIIEKWQEKEPIAPEPYYYKAHMFLAKKNYNEFVRLAEQHLFLEKTSISATMTRYHLAVVQAYLGDLNTAIKHVLSCIAVNPLMAEFWCLLGDIHYKLRSYIRAAAFYENAIILGEQRLKSDSWPIQISKYKEYPERMMESCKESLRK